MLSTIYQQQKMAIKKPDAIKISSNKQEEEENVITSKKVEVNLDDSKEEETIQMEFTDDEQIANSHATQQTKISKDESTIDDNTPIEKIQKDVADYEESKSGKLEYKDLKQTAAFLINLIDTALSTTFRLIAKDTSSSAYSMPAENKKLLIEQLALILAKYQSKFKIEFMFFMGLIVLYSPAAIAAVNNRKKVNKALKTIKEETLKQPGTPYYSKQVSENIEKQKELNIEKKPEEKIVEEIIVGRRRKGKQPKAF